MATDLCDTLGLPTAPDKTVSPATTLNFLGIEIDSCSRQLRVPGAKLSHLCAKLREWARKCSASKHELLVLLEQLGHVATIVYLGHTFIRHLIDLTKKLWLASQKVCLNLDCHTDPSRWADFIRLWNGFALFPDLPSGLTMISDALDTWGCGAYCETLLNWFQLKWPSSWKAVDITARVSFHCYQHRNSGYSLVRQNGCVSLRQPAVVICLNSHSSCNPFRAHLLRCLFFSRHTLSSNISLII